MIPYNFDENEYVEFMVKCFDKIHALAQDFDRLSERNKTRVMFATRQTLPFALFNLDAELTNRR